MPNEWLIERGTMPTPIGQLAVFTQWEVIVAIEFQDQGRAEARLRRFMARAVIQNSTMAAPVRDALDEYFTSGSCSAFAGLALLPSGTSFQQQVWNRLRDIPPGEIASYGSIAEAVGCPKASRAVGAANGQNPIPIIIPCHRVIGSNGLLTGYGSGVERKAWLLKHEGYQPAGGLEAFF